MTIRSVSGGGGSAGEGELRHLRLLARKNAAAEVTPATSGARLYVLEGQSRREIGNVERDAWRELVASGAVAAGADPAIWRLTRRGLQRLKQLLGAGTVIPAKASPERKAPQQRAPAKPGFNAGESPVAWLSRHRDRSGRPLVSDDQLQAAERLRADFWFAGLMPRTTTNWSFTGGGRSSRVAAVDLGDNVMAARERVNRALAAVGPELSGILVDVVCLLRGLETAERSAGWPQRTAKIVLQLALTRLARHYGLIPSAGASTPERARILHWGATDYRPAIEP